MMRLGLGRGARRRRSLGRRWKRRRPHAANFPHHQQSLHRRSDGSDLLLGESSCTGAKNDTHLSDGGPRRGDEEEEEEMCRVWWWWWWEREERK